MTENIKSINIKGKIDGERLASRVLEEQIQQAVEAGHRQLNIDAFGQHGIGGRLWKTGGESVHIKIDGHAGQRVGSMGYPGTFVDVLGPASDDVGWLNAGAVITVHGHASNGVANGMAQGNVYIAGNIGARGMTMTKNNPRFEPRHCGKYRCGPADGHQHQSYDYGNLCRGQRPGRYRRIDVGWQVRPN